MRTSRLLALAVTTAVLGSTAGAVHAAPSESQRLRGMEGRSFAVEVFELSAPEATFPNCYTFDGDDWIDPLLPAAGTWEQHSVGATTAYTASFGPVVQSGTVSPAEGRGVLQLHAVTEVPEGIFGPDAPALTFVSTGYEVDKCPT